MCTWCQDHHIPRSSQRAVREHPSGNVGGSCAAKRRLRRGEGKRGVADTESKEDVQLKRHRLHCNLTRGDVSTVCRWRTRGTLNRQRANSSTESMLAAALKPAVYQDETGVRIFTCEVLVLPPTGAPPFLPCPSSFSSTSSSRLIFACRGDDHCPPSGGLFPSPPCYRGSR